MFFEYRSRPSILTAMLMALMLCRCELINGQESLPGNKPSTIESPFQKYTFQHAKARDVLCILQQLTGEASICGAVDERTNSLIFVGDDDVEAQQFVAFFKMLDSKSVEPSVGDDMRVSVGEGIRINVPALGPNPVALDFAIGPKGNRESLQDQYSSLEQQAHQLADQIKQSKSSSESDKRKLQAAVRKSFEARQALQLAELADLAQRLKSMQQSIEMRDKLADKIIDRRVTDLLNPDLKWDTSSVSVNAKTKSNSNDVSAPTVESVRQKAQGKWIVESWQSEAKDDITLQGLELRIEGDILTFSTNTIDMQWQGLCQRKSSEGTVYNVNFVWDPNGDHQALPGIVSCDGESLKVCYGIPRSKNDVTEWRPERFIPGSRVVLMQCRRPHAPICTAPEPLAGRSTQSSELDRPSISGRWKINAYSEESLEVKDGEYGEVIIANGEICLVNPQKTNEVCTWVFDQRSIQPDLYTNKTCPINIVIGNGPACPGIIRLESDRLRICISTHELNFDDPDRYRPTEFRPGLKVAFLDCSRVTPNASEMGDYNKALNQLQGTWAIRSYQHGTFTETAGELKGRTIVIEGSSYYSVLSEEGQRAKASIQLNHKKSPKEIDLTMDFDDGSKMALFGIYSVDGESLRLCVNEESRPTEFLSTRENGATLITLEKTTEVQATSPKTLWSDFLNLLPESGPALVMFSFEPDIREQMQPVAKKVADDAKGQFIELPLARWRNLFSSEATHFVLMKDRQLVGTRIGLMTESRLAGFVSKAKDWLTPKSIGVDEKSLVRIDCYINLGAEEVGSQLGTPIPITTAVVAVHEDQVLLFGTEAIAEYIEKGFACVAIARDASGKEKQLPLDVVFKGPVKLLGRKKQDAKPMAKATFTRDDGTTYELDLQLPFLSNIYPKSMTEPLDEYDVGSAIYQVRGLEGYRAVKVAPMNETLKLNDRVLSGSFTNEPYASTIPGLHSSIHWQSQTVNKVERHVYGSNINGAELFEVLCPTRPAPCGFTFDDHGRLIGKYGLGSPSEKDMTHTVFLPDATHSVLRAAIERMSDSDLKASLVRSLEE